MLEPFAVTATLNLNGPTNIPEDEPGKLELQPQTEPAGEQPEMK